MNPYLQCYKQCGGAASISEVEYDRKDKTPFIKYIVDNYGGEFLTQWDKLDDQTKIEMHTSWKKREQELLNEDKTVGDQYDAAHWKKEEVYSPPQPPPRPEFVTPKELSNVFQHFEERHANLFDRIDKIEKDIAEIFEMIEPLSRINLEIVSQTYPGNRNF